MQTNINRQKVSRYFKSLYTLANLHRLLAPEESPKWKSQTLQDLRTGLHLKIFRNSIRKYKCKAKANSKTQHLILIYAEDNIYLNSWTKFPVT